MKSHGVRDALLCLDHEGNYALPVQGYDSRRGAASIQGGKARGSELSNPSLAAVDRTVRLASGNPKLILA